MNSKVNKPTYTLEFRQDATKLVLEKGYTHTEAASSLGVSLSALHRWVRAERGEINTGKPVLSLNEHEELIRLRKENARLKMEREILKKAAVFFAQEME